MSSRRCRACLAFSHCLKSFSTCRCCFLSRSVAFISSPPTPAKEQKRCRQLWPSTITRARAAWSRPTYHDTLSTTRTTAIPRLTTNRWMRSGGAASSGCSGSVMTTLSATPMPYPLPRPMLASLDPAPLESPRFAYEPKYDGIRAIVSVTAGGGAGAARIWSRLGNEKTAQFPEIARALGVFAKGLKADVLLDGEIVALDEAGEPAGFQRLQGRIHLTSDGDIGGRLVTQPVAFVAFDVLRDGDLDVRALPLTARRARLERIFGNT